MYPNNLFNLIPPFPRTNRVFVAMSFDNRFDSRWASVIQPAIERLRGSRNEMLQPFRVDLSRVSDAILTEILREIAECHCIVADITAMEVVNGRPIRNANVMYEVGLAHAARLPEEVILFRSDNHKIDFDVSGVRVHHYDPDGDAAEARGVVARTIADSLSALGARRRATLEMLSRRLTQPAFALLIKAKRMRLFSHPSGAINALQEADAAALLLELGAIEAKFTRFTENAIKEGRVNDATPTMEYALTPLGLSLFDLVTRDMGFHDPAVMAYFRQQKAVNEVQETTLK